MALTTLESLSVANNVESIVRAYLETQNLLFCQRRDLAILLFEKGNIRTSEQFDRIKNSIRLAYISNFTRTTFYKELIPDVNFICGREFTNDHMFYLEGCSLSKPRNRALLLDGQSIIIRVYQYLQKKTKNFVQRLKYAFENYTVEQSGEINYQKSLKTSELRLAANEEITDLTAPSVDKDTLIPKIDIAITDYHVPAPFAPIDGDVAKFIFEQILNGYMLDSDQWINDECINYYMHHVLEPMATEAQQNIKFISTYFFQRLYFDNESVDSSYAMDFFSAYSYWMDGGDQYIIPINILNEHWALVTVDIHLRTMCYYDSLGSYKGWDGTVFMKIIFDFIRTESEHNFLEFDMANWALVSSKDTCKWSDKLNRFVQVPQKDGHSCGLFPLKYAELFIKYPEKRKSLHDIIKKNMPDRSLYKKHFLGLFVEYQNRVTPNNGGTPQKRKKRPKEETWGTEATFKRSRSDRDKSDVCLRESTEKLAKVYVTTPTKPEKLSDVESDGSEVEATFSPVVIKGNTSTADDKGAVKADIQLECDGLEVGDTISPVVADDKSAVKADKQPESDGLEVRATFSTVDTGLHTATADDKGVLEGDRQPDSDGLEVDNTSTGDDKGVMEVDKQQPNSDALEAGAVISPVATGSNTSIADDKGAVEVDRQPDSDYLNALKDIDKTDISEIVVDKSDSDDHLFDSSEEDEISDITNSTKQKSTVRLTATKSTNPHVIAGVPHSYKHVIDFEKYSAKNFKKLIADYEIAVDNVKVFFQLPLQELLYDPPKSLRSEVLKLHYKHEDFRDYVHKFIEDELSKHRHLMKDVRFYTLFDSSKFKFDEIARKTRKEFKVALGGNFPNDRDLKTYPITVFKDVIREMPAEMCSTTILESPPPDAIHPTNSTAKNTDISETLPQESVHSLHEDAPKVIPAEQNQKSPLSTIREEFTMLKIDELKNMQDDEVSFIGVKLLDYKRKYIHSRLNKRLHELVIQSHDASLPSEKEKSNFPLKGFRNLGNTCFINSVLQCLFRISYFQTMIQEYNPPSTTEGKRILVLLKTLYDAVTQKIDIIEPLQNVVNYARSNQKFTLPQNDASEYLDSLFDHIHRELAEPFMYDIDMYVLGDPNKQLAHAAKEHWALEMGRHSYSKVKDILFYQILWNYKCLHCNQMLHMFEVNSIFKVRYVPLMKRKRCTIEELIQLSLGDTDDSFEGSCPSCNNESVTLQSTGTSRFVRNPNTLVISIDLYEFKSTAKNSGVVKKAVDVNYKLQPEGIDISSMTFQPNPQTKTIYRNFIGAVAHKGTRNTGVSGHYEALVRANSNNCAYNIISDEMINPNPLLNSGKRVTQMNRKDLKPIIDPLSPDDLKDPNSKYSRESYLLFYE